MLSVHLSDAVVLRLTELFDYFLATFVLMMLFRVCEPGVHSGGRIFIK